MGVLADDDITAVWSHETETLLSSWAEKASCFRYQLLDARRRLQQLELARANVAGELRHVTHIMPSMRHSALSLFPRFLGASARLRSPAV